MGIQVYVTEGKSISFQAVQVDENGDWMGEMQRHVSLPGDDNWYVWSSGIDVALEEMIQFSVSEKQGEVIVSCGFLVTDYVEFINYTIRTIKIVDGTEEKKEYRIESQRFRRFSGDALIAPPKMKESWFRRPAYWMRGKPVTREQAFEIIRRTDNYFSWSKSGWQSGVSRPEDFVPVYTIDSWWFDNHYPACYGWCRPDGRIGLDSITQRWPTQEDFILDGMNLMKAFPFLDMVLLLWDSEEERAFQPDQNGQVTLPEIRYGVHIHGQRVDILPPDAAWRLFCRYQLLYGEDPESYLSEYNEICGNNWVDREYLRRCLRANGMTEKDGEDSILYQEENVPPYNNLAEQRLRYKALIEACRKMEREEKKIDEK